MTTTTVTDSGLDWNEYLESVADEVTDVESVCTEGTAKPVRSAKRKSIVPEENTKPSDSQGGTMLYGSPMFLGMIFMSGAAVILVISFVELTDALSTRDTIRKDSGATKACLALGSLSNSIIEEVQYYTHTMTTSNAHAARLQNKTDGFHNALLNHAGYGSGLGFVSEGVALHVPNTFLKTLRNNFTSETEADLIAQAGTVLHELLLLTARIQRIEDKGHKADLVQNLLGLLQTEVDFQTMLAMYIAQVGLLEGTALPGSSFVYSIFKLSCQTTNVALEYLQAATVLTNVLPFCTDFVPTTNYSVPPLGPSEYFTSSFSSEMDLLLVRMVSSLQDTLHEEVTDTEKESVLWVTLACCLLVYGSFQVFIIWEFQISARNEASLRYDFMNAEGTTEMISKYCHSISQWELDVEVVGESRIEQHLINAVKSLTQLCPFVPSWVFDWDTVVKEGGLSIDQVEANAINFTNEKDDQNDMSRRESSASLASDFESGSSTNGDILEMSTTPVIRTTKHVNLTLGLATSKRTFALVSAAHLNSAIIADSDIPVKTVDSVLASFYKLLYTVSAGTGGAVVDINPMYAIIDFEWSDSTESRRHICACNFALKLTSGYKDLAKQFRVVERVHESSPSAFEVILPRTTVSLLQGTFETGIVTTGTFKTMIISGKEYSKILKMSRLAHFTGVNILTCIRIRKSAHGSVKGSFSPFGVLHNEIIYRLRSAEEIAIKKQAMKEERAKTKTKKGAQKEVQLDLDAAIKSFFQSYRTKKYVHAAKQLKAFILKHDGTVGKVAVPETPILKHLNAVVMDMLGTNKDALHEELQESFASTVEDE